MKYSKVNKSPLQQLIRDLLREDATDSTPVGGDSLDAQVDRYLADYESSSKSAKKEGRDFRMTLRRLLEADEEGGDDKQATPPQPAAPAKRTVNDIDIEEFANNVARLIENYDNLLEIRSTLIRRAIKYLSKSYDQSTVDGLTKLLRDEHGMVDGESKQDVDDEMFQAPPADRAGPGGAGS